MERYIMIWNEKTEHHKNDNAPKVICKLNTILIRIPTAF